MSGGNATPNKETVDITPLSAKEVYRGKEGAQGDQGDQAGEVPKWFKDYVYGLEKEIIYQKKLINMLCEQAYSQSVDKMAEFYKISK